jgi:arsenate reductase (glutaredoxin)
MLKVYHNNRCSKSRQALEFLDQRGLPYEVIYYLDQPFEFEELEELVQKLKVPLEALLRKGEEEYKMFIKGRDLSDKAIIQLMIEHPKIIERPVVVNGNQAVIARPAELIEKIL